MKRFLPILSKSEHLEEPLIVPMLSAKTTCDFDPKRFLATIGEGRRIVTVAKKQTIYAQSAACDAVYYIQTGISNNVGSVKLFLSTLLFSLKIVFLFRSLSFSFVFFLLGIDDHGSLVILQWASVRPKHLFDQNFDHDYYCKLPLTRERDAQSSGRRSSSRHARLRAVPRAN
jgi:hypothetical protein